MLSISLQSRVFILVKLCSLQHELSKVFSSFFDIKAGLKLSDRTSCLNYDRFAHTFWVSDVGQIWRDLSTVDSGGFS